MFEWFCRDKVDNGRGLYLTKGKIYRLNIKEIRIDTLKKSDEDNKTERVENHLGSEDVNKGVKN